MLFVVLFLLSIVPATIKAAAVEKEIEQLALVCPFFEKEETIAAIVGEMDKIEDAGKDYPDYGLRKGLIWSEFWTDTEQPNPVCEAAESVRFTQIEEQETARPKSYVPESIFDYPLLKQILVQNILPRTFEAIRERGWPLPPKVFAHVYLQSCHTSTPMAWHQDPGEDHDLLAKYSLVHMLSKQDDSVHGWSGGEFKIRSGLPADPDESKVKTIRHCYNQAVLFNNQINNHAVDAVTSDKERSKRDLMVVLIFEKMSQLLPAAIKKRELLLASK